VVHSLKAPSPETLCDTPRILGIGQIVERMYDNFNSCDADGTAACFTVDVVYEDLLLGNATIVESREDFRELIQSHPVFVGRRICEQLHINPMNLEVKVDNISEDVVRNTVGVEWHVEIDGEPLGLGRGLSFMHICPRTGLIRHAVDIAEAPWRAVGLLFSPFARSLRQVSRTVKTYGPLTVTLWMFITLTFLDRPVMDSLRAGIDSVADFRDLLDTVSVQDALNEMAGPVISVRKFIQ